MDPVQAAKKLIDSLVNQDFNVLVEADENDQEETETEDSGESQPQAQSQSGQGYTKDAHGGGVKDANGGTDTLGSMQYMDYSQQNQASIGMKPSFATAGTVNGMSEEQLRQDITTIFGNSDLSEDFVNKAGSIYEAAVIAKAEEVVRQVHEQYEAAFTQEVDDVKQELTEKVDQYLNYVVEEWMNDNKLAIESGIRTDIAESFISKLKDLFLESYIEVPQNKTNLFDEMANTIEELEARVNEELTRNVTLVNENKAVRAVGIFMEKTKHLTDVQSDKVRTLAENLEFESASDFGDKIKTIVNNISRAPVATRLAQKQDNNKYITEETIIESDSSEEESNNDPRIKLYSEVLTRTLK